MLSLGTEVFLAFWIASYERRVAGEVAAAGAGRDLDVLDQLGEQLAAPGVDDGLLVLGRRPLGVAAHDAPCTARPSLADHLDEQRVDAGVPGQLRVERGGQQRALPDGDDPTRGRPAARRVASTSTSGPDLLDPRRPDEDRVHRPPVERRRTSRSASNESTWRPKALRRTVMSRPPSVSWSGRAVEDPVGQQDHPGAGPVGRQPGRDRARAAARAGRTSTASLAIVVDSPPGRTSPSTPSSSAGRRTGDRVGARRAPAPRGARGRRPAGRGRRRSGAAHQPRLGEPLVGRAASSTLMPTIASPSPRDTLATTSGSS